MSHLNKLYASLTPEKRALLEKRLLQKNAPLRESAIRQSGPHPLSFNQESLWFFDQFESNSALYNLPESLRLIGSLNVEMLRRSFEAIVQRHESLRTNFIVVRDQPRQVVAGNKTFILPVIDLTALSENERQQKTECHLHQQAHLPFNLAEDVLLRAWLIRLRADEHILSISLHHIAADAWSLSLLHEELTTLYRSFSEGRTSPMPPLDFQYSDYALCQRERWQGELAEKQIAYWKTRLAGELPVLELPTDRVRPAQQSFRGAMEHFKFPGWLLSALKELSRRECATVYATTMAAFQILLQRYSRQDDILVGSPLAARNRSEAEKLIGYFINLVVLRSDLSGNPTFRDFLRQVNDNVLGALMNQEVPFERLVEELKVPRQPGRNPLVEVVFQYLAAQRQMPEFDGVTVEALPLDTRTAKFDLTLTLHDSPEGLTGKLEYNTDLFDAATIQRMIGHYRVLLENIVANPVSKIEELPLLTSEEEHQIVVEWNNTAVSCEEKFLIHELIEQQVARVPNQIAVACGEESHTYAELNKRTNQLARHLQKMGVGPETPVCLCLERSVEMIVGIVAVLKAGGAYVPFDPAYPKERLAFMLEETGSPIIVTQKKLLDKIPSHRGKNICIDVDWPTIAKENRRKIRRNVHAENLAYVIFTSGSTGKPKGVLVTHGNLAHSTMARSIYYRETVGNYLLISSFAFDSSVAGIFWTLACGGTLTVPEEGLHQDPDELIRLIQNEQVTHFLSLPSLYSLILETASPKQLDTLKIVIVAGESCGADLVKKHDAASHAMLFNEYGPTEASVWSTVERCLREVGKVSIGKPIPNTRIYLLDAHRNPVPVGVSGEIYIGGAGVVRGYLNDAKLTAEKFVPDTFSGKPGARLYRTGDLACFLKDGHIDFLGRVDHQVKLRGFRIELEEIEMQLKQLAELREVVVVVRENPLGEKSLAAYLVPSTASSLNIRELRARLKARLPEYLVPSVFVILDALPLTPNGKVDRKNLPAPEYTPNTDRFVPPETAIERQLAQVWCEVLGVKQIGLHDNFFELGGHSLMATRAISRVRALSQIPISLRDFFQSPTVAGLSAILENNGRPKTKSLPNLVPLRKKVAPSPDLKSFARVSEVSGKLALAITAIPDCWCLFTVAP